MSFKEVKIILQLFAMCTCQVGKGGKLSNLAEKFTSNAMNITSNSYIQLIYTNYDFPKVPMK